MALPRPKVKKKYSSSHKIDYLVQVGDILNFKRHQNCINGLKVAAILLNMFFFAYWWSFIRKGLLLQSPQQDSLKLEAPSLAVLGGLFYMGLE